MKTFLEWVNENKLNESHAVPGTSDPTMATLPLYPPGGSPAMKAIWQHIRDSLDGKKEKLTQQKKEEYISILADEDNVHQFLVAASAKMKTSPDIDIKQAIDLTIEESLPMATQHFHGPEKPPEPPVPTTNRHVIALDQQQANLAALRKSLKRPGQ